MENTSENAVENTPQSNTSNWLKELGMQSWQAELVLSGLLITILFQLPDMFTSWIEHSIIHTNELEYMFFSLASVYFMIGIYCLIFFFGIHLILRGIWIALLGLDSVFPKGIDVNVKGVMNETYWQKTKQDYPNLTKYCVDLDENCSLIFSLATAVTMAVVSTSVIIQLSFYLIRSLNAIFPIIGDNIVYIGIGLYLIYMVMAIVSRYFGKRNTKNKFIIKLITFYSSMSGIVFSLYVFKKPFGYITNILSSNITSKKSSRLMAFSCAIMGYFGATVFGNMDTSLHFKIKNYYSFNNKPEELLNINYENLINKESSIYTPIIQSDVVNDPFLKVFIPTIGREEEAMDLKSFSIIERFKASDVERDSLKLNNLKIKKQFNRIFVNNLEIKNIDFQEYRHTQADVKGLLVYIPTDSLPQGKNILEIRKNMFSKDNVQKIVKIPFFFKKNKE